MIVSSSSFPASRTEPAEILVMRFDVISHVSHNNAVPSGINSLEK
jgi:hypothetical protein